MVNLVINSVSIQTDPSRTILEVTRDHQPGTIPTLCQFKDLNPAGLCGICLVEIDGQTGLSQACTTLAAEGMVVHTDSMRIRMARKARLEELLSTHKADCYPPCRLECPAGMDIQGYIALALRGQYSEAVKLLKETNPLPMVCGKVCAKPCEAVCRRNFIDAPVDIKNIKRFIAKKDLEDNKHYFVPAPGPDTGRNVAIIGSGPAGLAAAFFLRKKGHGAEIFEMMPRAGGMMRYGIPEYRLPKADLQEEIDSILSMGVGITFNTRLGHDFTFDSLKKDGYDAIFVGIGAQLGSAVRTPGNELSGVIQGVDFLRDVQLGIAPKLNGTVFVIGGGNTAIDAARTALRYGAEKVSIVYRRTEAEMPAAIEEIHDAREEHVHLNELTNPVEYSGKNGRLTSVRLIKMALGEPDVSGRQRPIPIEGSEYDTPVDYIIEAIGQSIDTTDLENLELDRWNSIAADETVFTTNMEGIFAGGDVVSGPSIIISAIAHGRKAAHSIDLYLNGQTIYPEDRFQFKVAKEDFGKPSNEDFRELPSISRKKIEFSDVERRVKSFEEVELGFTEEKLKEETRRCLECGCQDVLNCQLKTYAFEYGADKAGFVPYDAKKTPYAEVAPPPMEMENPFIIRNAAKCILCGKCVQACNDVQVNNAIEMTYGDGKPVKVIAGDDVALKDSNCVFCGECVQACPTGALTEKGVIYRGAAWDSNCVRSTCAYCGVGCQIDLHVKDDRVIRITGRENAAPNYGSLCVKGRYGFDFLGSQDRLTHPLIKENGGFRQATWQEAFDLVGKRMGSIRDKNGPDSIGVLTSARVTNEENYLVQKFARAVIKTNNIDHCARL